MARDTRAAYSAVIGGMIGMAVAQGIGRFVYTPILPAMMEQLGQSASEAGALASASYLGYLLGAVFAGGAWAAGQERTLTIIAVAGTAVTLAAMGFTESFPLFLLLRFISGVGGVFTLIFVTSTVHGLLADAGRSDLASMHFQGVGVGIVLSSLIGAVTIGVGSSWRDPWFWAAGVGAAGTIAMVLLLRPPRGAVKHAEREPPLRRTLPLTLVILSYSMFGLGYAVTSTFLIAIVRGTGGSPMLETYVWMATGLAIIPSIYLWTLLSDRIGLARTYLIGCVTQAAGVVISVSFGGATALIFAGLLVGATFVSITSIALHMGRELAPLSKRRVMAAMTVLFGIGQIIAPLIAGYAADWTGSFVLPSLAAGLVMVLTGVVGYAGGRALDHRVAA